jgi:radical SAM protein with 4Fe4S-binding SPASM domain
VPGNYQKCLELIRELVARWPRMRVGIGMTITPGTVGDMEGVFRLAQELKVGFTTRFAQVSFYYHNESQAAAGWTPELKTRAHAELLNIRDRRFGDAGLYARVVDASYVFLTEAVERTFAPRRTHECFSGTYSFFLDPLGNIYPCIMLSRPMGNLRESPFDTIWDGERAGAVRRTIADRMCNCWTECETLPSLSRSISHSVRSAASALKDEARGRTRGAGGGC